MRVILGALAVVLGGCLFALGAGSGNGFAALIGVLLVVSGVLLGVQGRGGAAHA